MPPGPPLKCRAVKSLIPVVVALCLLPGCVPLVLPYDVHLVPANAETEPMVGRADQADDASLWVHPADSALSIILGTNKQGGLYVYDLAGRERDVLRVTTRSMVFHGFGFCRPTRAQGFDISAIRSFRVTSLTACVSAYWPVS
jgi:myo-inositol-hexaphosphate 3-phosphohydrolase